ncbi:Nck-associated protein 5-like [Pseudolycoriella hygida]|uniref:Nck-associated protein 5-like n=1 Tax=Pseudolycoriella hygida TaxID=35572 RepID=A0A9Q0N2W2_9DIPT|nr:Nck-associated protein 5-like [Pseudolycoriella hygida]
MSFRSSQCGSPTLEKDLKEQLEKYVFSIYRNFFLLFHQMINGRRGIFSMQKVIRSKERKAMQVCRDHKSLQARFLRQEHCLQFLTTENKNLHQRIRTYEGCLDDVMRKVVDAIVAEDHLREEVSMLKNRVRDLEAQNAALSSSPAKGRDEGYCTMSSGQPQPSGHLEDLPEEPEHLLMMAEPTSADMEDWSMSQEELGAVLEEYNNEPDWLWQSSNYLNSTVDSQSESISKLLQTTIEYSDDEEIGCKDFTSDFYRLVNITSGSTRSLHSGADPSDTDESIPNDRYNNSPTPSEAGLAQVSSCSSSDSSEQTAGRLENRMLSDNLRQDVLVLRHKPHQSGTQSMPSTNWRRSNGWRRVSSQYIEPSSNKSSINKDLRIPPPVPARRSFAS